jgi:GH18 family chitinase
MKRVCVYFESWASKWTSDSTKMDLGQISLPVTIVNLSFVSPGCSYKKGQYNFQNTGLNFSQDFNVVKGAIQLLRKKGIKVLLAVGGGSYWSQPNVYYNAAGCVALMRDLECDGIDLDWEVGINYGKELTNAISSTKVLLQAGQFLSFAGWSTGAYGPTSGSGTFQGMNIHAMVNQGKNVDWINIMAYDAGKSYDPIGALECYKIYYKGPLLLGFEVGTQGWGDAKLSYAQADEWMRRTYLASKEYGIFIWALLKESKGTVSVNEILEMTKKYL